MKKKILIFSCVLALAVFGIYKYAYKPQRNIATEKSAYKISADELTAEFVANDSVANLKYLDKTISIYGKITSIDLKNNAIVIEDKIYVTFVENLSKTLIVNNVLNAKARYIGYDDLIQEYRFDQGTVLE